MPRRLRLDAELVRRGLARSREQAAELIAAGRVYARGSLATKAATAVSTDSALQVVNDSDGPEYVSRGGHKLVGALAAFSPRGLRVAGRHALDAGASTGGFTDVLLRAGAASVTAVDVGYGQLAWSLQRDERVTVLDRTNVKDLTRDQLVVPPEVVTADLSFISLTKVLHHLVAVAEPSADLLLMVKPQFEVGRKSLGKSGVVRDPDLRVAAVVGVAEFAAPELGVAGVCASPLPGSAGNVEYFLWLRRGAPAPRRVDVENVVSGGPQ